MGLVRSNAHAIVMRQYGAPEVLTYASVPLPALGPDEVRIRTILTAVNQTDLEAEIRRSLFPTSWCCRAALPGMVQAGGGTMVKVSSVSTRDINRVPYAAAKGDVNAITACLALEYAEHGIRVCGVAPGGTSAATASAPASGFTCGGWPDATPISACSM
jgi:NAD(P)-dependent dehydrogenase (short-subunit alcohol dehydrogenase family)